MDPELVKGLKQIKEFLEQGIFTHQEFDDQKKKLIALYPVSRSAPLTTVVPQSPMSHPLKGVSDSESRDVNGRHRWGYHKCSKCPLLACYWSLSGFSQVIRLICPQASIEIPNTPGLAGNIFMSGVRTIVATVGHMSGVRTGSATADTRGNTVPPVLGTLPIFPAIPVTGNSFDLLPAIPMPMTSSCNHQY